MFLTKGVGVDKERLSSFELALRAAGIAGLNLVHVSSIFPPYCKLLSKKQGLSQLHPGEIAFCVMSRNDTNEPNRLISASVGLAIPNDRSQYGYLSEHEAYGMTERKSGDYAERLGGHNVGLDLGNRI
jgi:arginine decarboxylase